MTTKTRTLWRSRSARFGATAALLIAPLRRTTAATLKPAAEAAA
jgi:hypothetical protein